MHQRVLRPFSPRSAAKRSALGKVASLVVAVGIAVAVTLVLPGIIAYRDRVFYPNVLRAKLTPDNRTS
jgi:hypothetical protein